MQMFWIFPIRRANAADRAVAIGAMGLLTKPWSSLSRISDLIERSNVPLSTASILDRQSSSCLRTD
jgi:hypothetical protein